MAKYLYPLTRYVLIEKIPFVVEADYSNSPYAKNFPIKKAQYLVKHHPDRRFYSIVNADDNSWVVEKEYCKKIINK